MNRDRNGRPLEDSPEKVAELAAMKQEIEEMRGAVVAVEERLSVLEASVLVQARQRPTREGEHEDYG